MTPRFAEFAPNSGFDAAPKPDWLMVPLKGANKFYLMNDERMTVNVVNPAIADIYRADPLTTPEFVKGRSLYTVKGFMPGTTFVEVRDGRNRLQTRLEISVKKLKEVKLAFNYVSDKVGHTTSRNPADTDAMLTALNEIYTPQTNIVLKKHSVQNVRVEYDLGQVVGASSRRNNDWTKEWNAVISKKDRTANINLFFVWEYEDDDSPFTDNMEGAEFDKDCFIEDDVGDPTGISVIGHEIGHALGVPGESHFYKDRNETGLMYYAANLGIKIGKVHANMMNR